MTEHPILFSAPMVKALRADRKIQTRRTSGLNKVNEWPDAWRYDGVSDGRHVFSPLPSDIAAVSIRCPYGFPGDELWTRESGRLSDDGRIFIFSATPDECKLKTKGGDYHPAAHSYKFVPSIHMPRWASRDTLEVISATPERLHDMNRLDAYAEGIDPSDSFPELWDSINGPGEFAKNPWVWKIEFRRAR